jgi:hypothetical protein
MAGILTSSRDAKKAFVPAVHLRAVRAAGGPGTIRQLWRLRRLTREPWRFNPVEFYDYGLWRPLSDAALAAFVTDRRNRAFNDSLGAPRLGRADEVIRDKLLTAMRLREAGLPTSPTLAFFGPGRAAAPDPAVPLLPDREALAAFLGDPGRYPLFGKPLAGSVSHGTVSLTGVDPGRDRATLINGLEVPLSRLVAEIAEGFAEGYLFQPVLRHPEPMRAHVGLATGTLRIVTLMTREGPEVAYAKLKLPSATAMHDSHSLHPRGGALVDPATGRVTRVRQRFDPTGRGIDRWMKADAPFLGVVLPDVPQAVAAVREGHGLFPGHGILGWDVFLTEGGPIVNEVNANPFHEIYQRVAWEGILSPALKPLWDRAFERARAEG